MEQHINSIRRTYWPGKINQSGGEYLSMLQESFSACYFVDQSFRTLSAWINVQIPVPPLNFLFFPSSHGFWENMLKQHEGFSHFVLLKLIKRLWLLLGRSHVVALGCSSTSDFDYMKACIILYSSVASLKIHERGMM